MTPWVMVIMKMINNGNITVILLGILYKHMTAYYSVHQA